MSDDAKAGLYLLSVMGIALNAGHYLLYSALWIFSRGGEYHQEFISHEIAGLLWLWFFLWVRKQ